MHKFHFVNTTHVHTYIRISVAKVWLNVLIFDILFVVANKHNVSANVTGPTKINHLSANYT